MTPDQDLSARRAGHRAKATDEDLHDDGRYFMECFNDLTRCTHGDTGSFDNHHDGSIIALLWNAYRSGQLITLADHGRAVQAAVAKAVEAEREAIAQIADAYADENIRMAGDSVLFDPVLSSKHGDVLTRGDFVKSEELILDGAIHSAMFHAAQNIAAAIRSRGVADLT